MSLDELNTSELLLLAQDNNPNAHRGLPRDLLVSIAHGEEVEIPDRHIDKIRLRIMVFVDAHFKQVEPLLSCPARTRDLRACFQCTDIQVAECALGNPLIFDQRNK